MIAWSIILFICFFFLHYFSYHSRKLYIIDVSQSVEHDHPHASEFLRKDLANVTDYFAKKGVRVMSVVELFKFVTDITFDNEEANVDAKLEEVSCKLNPVYSYMTYVLTKLNVYIDSGQNE